MNPNWAEATTAIGTVVLAIATAALAIAATAALVQIREARQARNAQVALDISNRWTESEFRKVRQQVDTADLRPGALKQAMIDFKKQGADDYRSYLIEPHYFEDLGVLVDNKLIDLKLVRDQLGITVARRWDIWKPFVEYLRTDIPNATAFQHFQDLARQVREAEIRDGHDLPKSGR